MPLRVVVVGDLFYTHHLEAVRAGGVRRRAEEMAMGVEGGKADGSGISRRSMIKRSAVVGAGAVWAAPVIDSFISPAAAATATKICLPDVAQISYYFFNIICGANRYRIKVTGNNVAPGAVPDNNCNTAKDGLAYTAWTDGNGSPADQVTVDNSGPNTIITVPAGCTIEDGLIYGHDGGFGNNPPCTPPVFPNNGNGKCHCKAFTASSTCS
jgi:hypothetical protein